MGGGGGGGVGSEGCNQLFQCDLYEPFLEPANCEIHFASKGYASLSITR